MRSIPHLNELTDKFGKKGLTIVGVTDEPASTIKPFIADKGIKYLIALGGAGDYTTSGIPHAWLVSPRGTVLWEGHPAGLEESLITDNLKDVRLGPNVELPKELSTASKLIEAGKLAAAVKDIEGYVKKPKSPESGEQAKKGLDALLAYGKSLLDDAQKSADAGSYDEALDRLTALENGFKGHDLAKQAKDKLAEWKKDKTAKLEVEAAVIVNKARALMDAGQHKAAAQALAGVTKPKKFADIKMRATAEKLLMQAMKRAGATG